jgi:hypothetical protein
MPCIDFVVNKLMVDAARSSSQAKNGVCDFVYVHFIVIRCSVSLAFLLLRFLSALTPFPDKLSAVPAHIILSARPHQHEWRAPLPHQSYSLCIDLYATHQGPQQHLFTLI